MLQKKCPESLLIQGKIHVTSDIRILRTLYEKHVIFSHPDFTVGPGITPDRPHARFTDLSMEYMPISGNTTESPSVGNIAYASTLPRRIPYLFYNIYCMQVTLLCQHRFLN